MKKVVNVNGFPEEFEVGVHYHVTLPPPSPEEVAEFLNYGAEQYKNGMYRMNYQFLINSSGVNRVGQLIKMNLIEDQEFIDFYRSYSRRLKLYQLTNQNNLYDTSEYKRFADVQTDNLFDVINRQLPLHKQYSKKKLNKVLIQRTQRDYLNDPEPKLLKQNKEEYIEKLTQELLKDKPIPVISEEQLEELTDEDAINHIKNGRYSAIELTHSVMGYLGDKLPEGKEHFFFNEDGCDLCDVVWFDYGVFLLYAEGIEVKMWLR